MSNLPPVIMLMGPTASGKSAAALQLAAQFNCDVISVDSALVYRGMDIGTAKPTSVEMAQTAHHLVDICDPVEEYSAGRFRPDALAAMAEVTASGRIPLLAGGTMLYFRVLQQGLAELPTADAALREKLNQEAEQLGWPVLHRRLAECDPEAAARIKPNDRQRIQRMLEIYMLSGTTWTELTRSQGHYELPYRVIKLALIPPRELLHQRLDKRLQQMLEGGFLEEVEGLHRRPELLSTASSMRAVGYRQLWAYLDGHCTLDEAMMRALVATRQLAKRQLTWLRRESDTHCFSEAGAGLMATVEDFLGTLHRHP